MAVPVNILCIDDELSVLNAMQRVFRDSKLYKITTVQEAHSYDLKHALEFDVIVCDQRMPGIQGSEIFSQLSGLGYGGIRIICSAFSDFDDITTAFNNNDIDYFLNKPWDNHEIRSLVNSSIRKVGTTTEENKNIENVYKLADKAAKTQIPVYIQGESGTGKELLTRYIHDHSERKGGPYITVNCATLTTELFESLMFGHKKGAFTGASEDHMGFYQAAHNGTLLLDEVVDIPQQAQAKILRALQEKCITRLGDTHNIQVDVRIISASAKPMDEAVKNGEFREDLMYRLNVYPIQIPPLRNRVSEIEILFNHFMKEFNYHDDWPKIQLTQEFKNVLLSYRWPGNIRELENTCNYLCATLDNPIVQLDDLPSHILKNQTPDCESDAPQVQAQLSIEEALEQCHNNKSKAAKLLGISRMTLWRHLKNSS